MSEPQPPAPDEQPSPGEHQPSPGEQPRSGLRNPPAAVRGVGAAALALEGLVLLLAVVPLRVLGGAGGAGGSVTLAGLALACFVLAGLLRQRWAWWAGLALQVLVFACGFLLHPAVGVIGVVFGLAWLYALSVRRAVLGRRTPKP